MLNKVIAYSKKFATRRMLRTSELTEIICKDTEICEYLEELDVTNFMKQRELVSNILESIGGNYEKESEYKVAIKDILLDCLVNEKCRNYVFSLVGQYNYIVS